MTRLPFHALRRWRTSALLVMLSAMSASAQSASVFGPGEQLSYSVSWLGLKAGTAQITVGAPTRVDDAEVWPIVMLARTQSVAAVYPIRDKFVSYWEPTRQRSVGTDFLADEGRKRRRQRVRVDPERRLAVVRTERDGDEDERQHEVDPEVLDLASAAFAVRNRGLRVGEHLVVPVFTGDRSVSLSLAVDSKQSLDTALGRREVLKTLIRVDFRGKLASKGDLVAYFTADPAHVLVRIEAELLLGRVVAELTDYQPGKDMGGADREAPGPALAEH